MSRPRPLLRRLGRAGTSIALVITAAVAGATLAPGEQRTVQAVGELGAGGEFHGLAPARVFDSRDPALDVAPPGKKATDDLPVSDVFDVQIVGEGGLPAFTDDDGDGADDNVLAVVVNITVIAPTQAGYLRAFGTGAPEGTTSVVNFKPGATVPNTAVLRPGEGGRISVRLVSPQPGSAHVAIDISGWFSSSSYGEAGARVIPIEPGRVYDSALAQFGGGPLGARSQTKVQIRGASAFDAPGDPIVPNSDDVVGVVVNITGVNSFGGSQQTFVSAVPEALPAGVDPTTSNLNLSTGQFRANLTIMPVGADGSIHLFNLAGQVRLVVDVVGFLQTGLPEDTRTGRVVPLVAPFRAFDTRLSEHDNQPLPPANAEDWSFESFINDVRIGNEPVGAQLGLLGNLTGTNLQRQYSWASVTSFITAFPTPSTGNAVPVVSNLNLSEGNTVPNMVLLTYGERASSDQCQGRHCVRFYNLAGYVDYLLDVSAVILAD